MEHFFYPSLKEWNPPPRCTIQPFPLVDYFNIKYELATFSSNVSSTLRPLQFLEWNWRNWSREVGFRLPHLNSLAPLLGFTTCPLLKTKAPWWLPLRVSELFQCKHSEAAAGTLPVRCRRFRQFSTGLPWTSLILTWSPYRTCSGENRRIGILSKCVDK